MLTGAVMLAQSKNGDASYLALDQVGVTPLPDGKRPVTGKGAPGGKTNRLAGRATGPAGQSQY